jgi:hypothetical protein
MGGVEAAAMSDGLATKESLGREELEMEPAMADLREAGTSTVDRMVAGGDWGAGAGAFALETDMAGAGTRAGLALFVGISGGAESATYEGGTSGVSG